MNHFEQLFNAAYDEVCQSVFKLVLKKEFSEPKIYTANGDLSKRWYVYYSYRSPKTGKLKRMNPFYGISNRFQTKKERLEVLAVYKTVLHKLLKQGFSPFEDNKALYERLQSKQLPETTPEPVKNVVQESIPKPVPKQTVVHEEVETAMPYKEALYLGLKFKEKIVNNTTKRGYKNRVDIFIRWIEEHRPEVKTIDDLTKKVVSAFLNSVLEKNSPRNRNNYRTDLGSILQVLEDNDILKENVTKKITVLRAIPQRNKTYTKEEQQAIFQHLEKEDPILLLYIKFISYNFLRPIEVCRLTVGSINVKDRTVQFKAKNSPLKTKIIPEILFKELPDLSKLNKDDALFTPKKIGAQWDTELLNRRDYFSKRFRTVVKDKFNLGKDYGLYSFRHTFITKLYRAMVEESSPFEAKSRLMLITGHTSMSALEKYLRDIDAELPKDYSAMLKDSDV